MSVAVKDRSAAYASRLKIREGHHNKQTSGFAPGFAQANLVILPQEWARDFFEFCYRNPKACPLLAVGRPGDVTLPTLGKDINISTDVPKYRVFKDGIFVEEIEDCSNYWRADFVSFLIGCSFSFEWAILKAGIEVRHIALDRNVPMYRTNIQCESAGPFEGPFVVSMRPMKPKDAITAIQLTGAMPQVHGAPIHFGDPEEIGIADIANPDFGDAVPIYEGEVPVFWACGVTPQVAVMNAKPEIAITHSPGCMLVTDITDDQLVDGTFAFNYAEARKLFNSTVVKIE